MDESAEDYFAAAAGWELVQVSTTITLGGHTYLFRRPKK